MHANHYERLDLGPSLMEICLYSLQSLLRSPTESSILEPRQIALPCSCYTHVCLLIVAKLHLILVESMKGTKKALYQLIKSHFVACRLSRKRWVISQIKKAECHLVSRLLKSVEETHRPGLGTLLPDKFIQNMHTRLCYSSKSRNHTSSHRKLIILPPLQLDDRPKTRKDQEGIG